MKTSDLYELRRVLAFGSHPWLIIGGLLTAVAYTVAQMTVPFAVSRIIDGTLVADTPHQLLRWTIVLGFLAVSVGTLRELEAVAFAYLEQRALVHLRAGMLAHLHELPISYFEAERSGRLSSLFMTEAPAVVSLFNPILGDGIVQLLQLLAVIGVVAYRFGTTVLVPLLLIPIYITTPMILNRLVRAAAQQAADARTEAGGAVQESIDMIREVKTFTQEDWDTARVKRTFGNVQRRQLRVNVTGSFYGFGQVVYLLTVAFLYWFGGRQVQSGQITIGDLIALIWYVSLLASPTNQLIAAQGKIQTVLGSAARIFSFLDSPREERPASALRLTHGKLGVEFESVRFTYSGARQPALDGISFRADPGEKIAVVGPSGAGKSTLIQLLLRFYDPQEGRILIGGRDVRLCPLDSLRREVSLVSQEPQLFSISVRDNIRFGEPTASDAQVEHAARLANAHDFITALPEGYDTEVGERGVKMSVGQKQRIAIARVVLRDPSILILDEATSALDAESELLVREALDRLAEGRTTFVIAHRLASVVESDRILVLEQGRLVAQGRHQDLLRASPLYRRLVSLQFGSAELAGEPKPLTGTG
jgi:ATP-binding cassette, subfamily B, bacterial MsbA